MKRSGLKVRQLGSQGPYSSLALRAFKAQTEPVEMPSSAACLEAPLADISGNAIFTSSSNALKEDQSESTAADSKGNGDKAGDNYWGGSLPKATKADGLAWRWSYFMPWESYTAADASSVHVEKHHKPKSFTDKLAYYAVKILNIPVNLFYQMWDRVSQSTFLKMRDDLVATHFRIICLRRHISHAMLLETVAAVPGMVAGMLLHLKSLRRLEHDGGWINALLEEAENERMHLMTFIELAEPKWYDRALVIAVQCAFFIAYLLFYLVSPELAHRLTGYLEEEAVTFYTEFLNDLDNGSFENPPATQMAVDYWRLTPQSTLRDVIVGIRDDEAHHRDLNHYASDIYCQGHDLNEVPLLQLTNSTKC